MSKIYTVTKIALPAVGEMLLYMLVWGVDTAFVGHYGGNNAVSAVGLGSEIVYTTVNIFIAMGVAIGITTTVAQSIGAGKSERAEEFLSQGLLIGSIIAFILSLMFGIIPDRILLIAGARGEVLILGSRFMRIVAIGAFFNMLNSMLNSGLRGSGNTVTPLIVSGIINVITIFLDWVLIFGRFGLPALGVKGSAIATSVAYFVGFVFLLFYYKYYSEFKFRVKYINEINKNYLKKIIRLAIPSGLQEGSFSVSRLISLMFIMHLGTAAFAANQITTTIESVSFMPGWGFAVASTALVGQRIGAKDPKTAKEYAWISLGLGTLLMLICSVLFLTIPSGLMKLFITEKETIKIGTMCLMVASIEQPFMALGMILEGSLKGSGDTKTPFLIALGSNWLIRLPLMYYVIYILKWSVVYAWGIMVIQWAIEGLLALILFHRKSSRWNTDMKTI